MKIQAISQTGFGMNKQKTAQVLVPVIASTVIAGLSPTQAEKDGGDEFVKANYTEVDISCC